MRVIFFDIEPRLPLGNAKSTATLEVLLLQSDAVTLHVPQSERTHNMMDSKMLAQMKDGAVLINLARGDAVDVAALFAALRSSRLRGAAVDVFPMEPSSVDEAFDSPLCDLDNVILTPHIGGSTVEAQHNLGVEVSEKLRDYLTLGAIRASVNLAELPVGPLRSPARLIHLHRDRPGVMAKVNATLSSAELNVTQLHLETLAGCGVAVIDVSAPLSETTLDALQMIEGTTRVFSVSHP